MNHFDQIADYDAEIEPHLREHYLRKKISLIQQCLESIQCSARPRILDVGCGTGWHMHALGNVAEVAGVDSSGRQVSLAQSNNPECQVLCADATDLPFENGSFDLVFSINMIHHLPSRVAQKKALDEMRRVTRNGGLVVIHDINVKNPIIRFYMNYVFPRLHTIDSGGEIWIDPEFLSEVLGKAQLVRFFTFVPEITPPALLPLLRPFESLAERSFLAQWGAHFMVAHKV
jgi:SAM-dependent methyltransferase